MHRLSNRLLAPRLRARTQLSNPYPHHHYPDTLPRSRWLVAHQHSVSARWLATDNNGSPLLPPPQLETNKRKEYLSIFGEENQGYSDPDHDGVEVEAYQRSTTESESSFHKSTALVQNGIDMEDDEEESLLDSLQESQEDYPYRLELNKYYRDVHDVSLKSAFLSEGIRRQEDNNSLWTSTFICPVLGERIESGKLPGKDIFTEIEGRYYYGKKKVAMQAAAMEVQTRLVSSMRFQEKAVRTELELWYRHNHDGVTVTGDSFEARLDSLKGKDFGGNWWTASFTCPVSGVMYYAGTLKDSNDGRRDSNGTCSWYRKKAAAMAAVASQVLDIKRFQETGTLDPRYCEEDPSTFESEVVSTSTTTDDIFEDQSFEKILNENLAVQTLSKWYKENHVLSIGKESFVSTMATLNGEGTDAGDDSWWTSSFLCPVTGLRYDSAKLDEYSNEINCDSEGVIWYKREAAAIAAAASRAMYSIRNVKSDVEGAESCDPGSPSRRKPETVDATSKAALSTTTFSEEGSQGDNNMGVVGSTLEHQIAGDIDEPGEDEDDYIVQYVSSMGSGLGLAQSRSPQTTLGLIAETWMESSSPQADNQNLSPQVEPVRHAMPRNKDPRAARQKAIDAAMQWVDKQKTENLRRSGDKVHFELDQRNISLQIANIMLDSLAKANACLHFKDNQSGVEEAATALVEMMWSSRSGKPNAEMYASYLKCLEGDDPLSVALRAQGILEAMKTGTKVEGRTLPQPNIAVTNAVIQLWARVGGTSGRFRLDDSITPNRDTFLSMLSSMTYPATVDGETAGFDADYARECMGEMRKLFETTGETSFIPDIQAYNAGLRRSGGLVPMSSRQYAESLPWDAYHELFQNGFLSRGSDDPLVIEATAMDNWLIDMEKSESPVSPDIETYESVIQAWIRTGTKEGLVKGEALGNRLVEGAESYLQPRVQTFHPIISALVYSRTEGGPEKVEQWLHRLRELPDLFLDGRLLAAPIKAYIADQSRLLEACKGGETNVEASKGKDEAIERAKQSSQCLAELVDRLKEEGDFFLEAEAFTLAIQGWYNASIPQTGETQQDQCEFLLSEAQEVVQTFNDLIASISSSEELRGKSELVAWQFRHLMESAPKVYSTAMLCLRRHQELKLESYSGTSHRQAQQAVELIFRRCEELGDMERVFGTKKEGGNRGSMVLVDHQNPKSSNYFTAERISYDDLFQYSSVPFLNQPIAETRIELLSQLFHLAEESGPLFQDDDDLRKLCVGATESLLHIKTGELNTPSVGASQKYIDLLKEVRNKDMGKTSVILGRLIRDLEDNKERARRMNNSSADSSGARESQHAPGDQETRKRRSRVRWSRRSAPQPNGTGYAARKRRLQQ